MKQTVTWCREGRIGLIRIDNPPVNAAGRSVRRGLVDALDALAQETTVDVIALYGAGKTFVAGADIREFGTPPRDPLLPEVCNRIEACETPVIAVLHGAALGGGLEIAMAAHLRVALPDTKLGLPEVTLGIVPGAGGTQRAPRLIGMSAALDLILSGKPVATDHALKLGLVDTLGSGQPQDAALAAAQAVLAGTLPTRKTKHLSVEPEPAALAAARAEIKRRSPHLFAPARAIEAIEAATRPTTEGLATERALFNACLASPQRAGLVHAFFAERAVRKIPEEQAEASAIRSVGVVGGGTMGSGIAAACLIGGLHVTLVDPDAPARRAAMDWIATTLQGAAARGKLADPAEARARISAAADLGALADVDVVIEAVPEEVALKEAVFKELSDICRPDALLATNTSYLDINRLAGQIRHPERFLGLHFFAPAHVMRLLEVVVGAQTAPQTVATAFALAKQLRKVAVRSGVCDGFIGNRILSATRRAAEEMVLLGARPAQVDTALESFGLAMGPFAAQDLSGLDIGAAGRALRWETAPVADALIARGALGRKTGAGFYTYGAERDENPALDPILASFRAAAGPRQDPPGETEIVNRYMAAMIAEGCRILGEGIALRAIDIDAVLLFGYGFPRHRGGPMHFADQEGLQTVIDRIQAYAAQNPALWSVPDLLLDRARNGSALVR